MGFDSLTVAGAAPALPEAPLRRTGFPFNPDAANAGRAPESRAHTLRDLSHPVKIRGYRSPTKRDTGYARPEQMAKIRASGLKQPFASPCPSERIRQMPYLLSMGRGESYGHHGEILQGVIPSAVGIPRPILVTLPCLHYRVTVCFFPAAGNRLQTIPAARPKAARAALLTLSCLGVSGVGGLLFLNGNIPPGQGLGSSSADVTATIRAVADACGQTLAPERIARLAVAAETASDPLMFDGPALVFAQREGFVVERFDNPLPPMELLSVQDPANGSGIDTLSGTPRRYERQEMARCQALLETLRAGIARGDAGLVGAVATASARLNQRFVRKPRLDELEAVGRHHGALGVQVAHSGTVMGLLFRPGDRDAIGAARRQLAARGWKSGLPELPTSAPAIAPDVEDSASNASR